MQDAGITCDECAYVVIPEKENADGEIDLIPILKTFTGFMFNKLIAFCWGSTVMFDRLKTFCAAVVQAL